MSVPVFVGGGKGGTTKTATAHLLCLGAVLCRQPAAYVLTDPRRELKSEGRPYGVLDGRDTQKLAQIVTANKSSLNGWLVIDGGGNRPEFDKAMAAEVELCLLPFRDSDEDLETIRQDLKAIPHAMAWPSAWPTNKMAQDKAQHYIDDLTRDFPLRVITPPIYFVNSAKELLDKVLGEPSTIVRNAARRAFGIMIDHYEAHYRKVVPAADEKVA
jgi:hypothetical protein